MILKAKSRKYWIFQMKSQENPGKFGKTGLNNWSICKYQKGMKPGVRKGKRSINIWKAFRKHIFTKPSWLKTQCVVTHLSLLDTACSNIQHVLYLLLSLTVSLTTASTAAASHTWSMRLSTIHVFSSTSRSGRKCLVCTIYNFFQLSSSCTWKIQYMSILI